MSSARVGGLGIETYGYERMVLLASRTLADLAGEIGDALVPIVLAVPAAGRADDDPRFGADLVHELTTKSGVRLDKSDALVVRAGHAGGAYALEHALAWLEDHEQVLVGAVDSYHHPDVLAWLDDECRLHAPDAEDGFVPGEAAAFCLLSRPDAKQRHARLTYVATALDPSADESVPDTAKAMTALLHQIGHVPNWAMVDDNGERHRSRTWVMAQLRTLAADATITKLPSEHGDLGAATGMVALALSSALLEAEAGASNRCVVALHSDDGERGVFVLEAHPRS